MTVAAAYRFSYEDVSGKNLLKASVQRKIRQSIAEEVCDCTLTAGHCRSPVDFKNMASICISFVSSPFIHEALHWQLNFS